MKRYAIAAAVALAFAGAVQAAVTELIVYKEPGMQGESHVVKGEVNELRGDFAGKSASIVARGGYWEVCNDDRFKGTCRVLAPGEYPNLGNDLRNRVVSIRFLGDNPSLAARVSPEYRLATRDARREVREERREARSDWLGNPVAIDLYGQPDFRGRSVRVEANERNLAERRFDGRASSAIVHDGTWQICSEPGFRGTCSVLRPGEYPQLAMLDDQVSSVRRLR